MSQPDEQQEQQPSDRKLPHASSIEQLQQQEEQQSKKPFMEEDEAAAEAKQKKKSWRKIGRKQQLVEEIEMDSEQEECYAVASRLLLQDPQNFLAPIPTVVSVHLERLPRADPGVAGGAVAGAAATGGAVASMGTSATVASVGAGTPPLFAVAAAAINTAMGGGGTAAGTNGLQQAAAAAALYNHHHQPITLVTPTRGHHALFRALEELEGLEKEEAALLEHCPLTTELTELLLRPALQYPDPRAALQALQAAGLAVPRRVCQHPFKKHDIVWVCRTCQADETCVLCHACFSQSQHSGHDVAFYHAQAGGCCDCGDPDAWDPAGFCPHHGPDAASANPDDTSLPQGLVHRVRGVVPAVVDWMVQDVAEAAEVAYRRAHPLRKKKKKKPPTKKKPETDSDPNSHALPHDEENMIDSGVALPQQQGEQFPTYGSSVNGLLPSTSEESTGAVDVDMEDERANQSDDGDDDDDSGNDHSVDDGDSDIDDEIEHDETARDGQGMPVAASASLNVARAHVFSPTAASMTTATAARFHHPSLSTNASFALTYQQQQQLREREAIPKRHDETAAALGAIGTAGHGLYLVLHASEIHSSAQLLDALREFLGSSNYYTDTLLGKLIRSLKQYGQLVVWGVNEVAAEVGWTQIHLWFDGDKVAQTRIGAVMLERASRLTKHGMFCSILTRDELMMEQRAVAILQWLSEVARSCDPLCQTVAECILPNRHLVPLLRADFKMSARVTKAWYSLLLTLLAVPTFKSHLAAAYCDTYRSVTAKYARGMGVLERTGYTLSVQFLNRVTYVVDLVRGRDLLGKLGKSLLETLQVARSNPKRERINQYPPQQPLQLGRLNPNHFVLTHRRYSPCISDLKCVLNVKGMPRLFACKGGTFLEDWVTALSTTEFMDPQVWRHWTQGHVEDENRGWVGAFNASISLGSLFERLLGWEDDEPSPILDPDSPLSRDLMPCVEMSYHILVDGIAKWQRKEMPLYEATANKPYIDEHRQCPNSLPFSTIAAKRGTCLAMQQLPVSQVTPFSFHLPLHRFVAGCLRELCLRKDDATSGMLNLLQRLRTQLTEQESDDLIRGLMEFPVLVMSRAAQIKSTLWRRNGPGLNDQVLNYSEPPFCRTMRDADLILIQFAVIARVRNQSPEPRPASDVGMAFFVNLLLHRLGLFDYAGLVPSPNCNIERYLEETRRNLYPLEVKTEDFTEDYSVTLPWTYSASRDAASSLLLLEEFVYLMIVFSSELPPVVPHDREDHTKQARRRLYREVVHKLASGPKTHSELSEVHHVLSHWDNVLLSEEGKELNPDDATGAALGTVLAEIGDRKVSRAKMDPDKWEMKRSAWDFYDPAFYHISQRSHQTAAEGRPKPSNDARYAFGWEPKPYAPAPAPGHPFFERLRRDVTSDATVLAIVYRILHMHCRQNLDRPLDDMKGKTAYESKERSETALARAVHLLTLGAYAWGDAESNETHWRDQGGGSVGSVFWDRSDKLPSPTVADWIKKALVSNPRDLMDSDWYETEEDGLLLLQRIAVSGGVTGEFVAQDACVRSGAAWLCEYARKKCPEASRILTPINTAIGTPKPDEKAESEADRRRRLAREKAMAKMKAQAAKFASMMDVDLCENDDAEKPAEETTTTPSTPRRPIRASSFESGPSSTSSTFTAGRDNESGSFPDFVSFSPVAGTGTSEHPWIPPRLLKTRPRCIICNDEEHSESRMAERTENDDGEGQRKKSRRKTENALGFVGYAQPSTVLKGGGGPLPDLDSPMSPVREFVGTHVALCGHAVHSECCESYLATVSHREDRAIGKRDEFRCPLCQRLSNCLVPFIDVGVDWIEPPTSLAMNPSANAKSDEDGDAMQVETSLSKRSSPLSFNEFLSSTPWWVARHSKNVVWDSQSAFIDRTPGSCSSPVTNSSDEVSTPTRKPARRRTVRSLKKKDLYAAWNAMMRTPRFVRRRLRPRGLGSRDETPSQSSLSEAAAPAPEPEESAGETIVWRRFMDQLSDLSYRADSKRLGDEHLHDLFGEFRHYIVEKYAYNVANRYTGSEPVDWPSCVFSETLPDTKRQEMSREKLLSKLLLSVQAFTYSCCCESYEARRVYRKSLSSSREAAGLKDTGSESIFSRFGISGVVCNGRLVIMPPPSAVADDGCQPFDGRLGKLRYLGLAVMAAAGAVAADLVQIVLPFPLETQDSESIAMDVDIEKPDRAPVAYPILFGNVLTHVVAAMCATCGRGRARSDSLEIAWPIPFSARGSFVFSEDIFGKKRVDCVMEDCEGFIKLGLLARILQLLLGKLQTSSWGFRNPMAVRLALQSFSASIDAREPTLENRWIGSCVKLLQYALHNQSVTLSTEHGDASSGDVPSLNAVEDAALLACSEAASFLAEVGTILQVLVPGVTARYDNNNTDVGADAIDDFSSGLATFEKLRSYFKLEPLEVMLQSVLVLDIISEWYGSACRHAKASLYVDGSASDPKSVLRSRLYRTQGYRVYDWPSPGVDFIDIKRSLDKDKEKSFVTPGKPDSSCERPEDEAGSPMQVESMGSLRAPTSTLDLLREQKSPALVTFSSKKTVPLLGGFIPDALIVKADARPRVAVMPTSYTDLYAELGSLLPDCEQTAVCLICGEVLNAGGKGECTRHSYKCGAGAGMFFLLQECSGLIMHKSKAAYIHSPYVDSHGETPQYRGRPLNLDLDRYEHLREVWYGHSVRQQVVAERASSRQVILPDFY